MLFLELWITTSRLVIDDEIRPFKNKAQPEFVTAKNSSVKVTFIFPFLWYRKKGKFGKHNYGKVSRNKNIWQILHIEWFDEMVPASNKQHGLL